MKAKLIKREDGYELLTQGFLKGSTNHELIDSLNVEEGNIRYKLSIKNCQAIERGYDLDELAYSNVPNGTYETSYIDLGLDIYKEGFQKAIELMGDKKFSEDELRQSMWDLGDALFNNCQNGIEEEEPQKYIDIIIQSLQQTEWDVEVEMVKEHIGSGCYKKYPKSDDEGCLILKKI